MPCFPEIDRIRYEGPDSDSPLAFRHYNADKIILGKPMREHLRMAACYWHTFVWPGADMFGFDVDDGVPRLSNGPSDCRGVDWATRPLFNNVRCARGVKLPLFGDAAFDGVCGAFPPAAFAALVGDCKILTAGAAAACCAGPSLFFSKINVFLYTTSHSGGRKLRVVAEIETRPGYPLDSIFCDNETVLPKMW